jgi:DNA-binding response OmpR family regulator
LKAYNKEGLRAVLTQMKAVIAEQKGVVPSRSEIVERSLFSVEELEQRIISSAVHRTRYALSLF